MKNLWMSVMEMSRTLGISMDNAYRLIYAGKVEAQKLDGKWSVSRKSVEERIAQRGRRHGA